MPITMKSLKSHRYGTRMLTAGEEFEVPGESAVRLLSAMKWAERKPPEPPAPPPVVETPAWRRPRAVVEAPAEPVKPKRTYTRRDITPTED